MPFPTALNIDDRLFDRLFFNKDVLDLPIIVNGKTREKEVGLSIQLSIKILSFV